MSELYILDSDNRTPVPVDDHDVKTWGEWYEKATRDGTRFVAKSDVGILRVSTVFLGLNHRFGDDGPPLLFETMVFVGKSGEDLNMERYTTWDQALAGHMSECENAYALALDIQEDFRQSRVTSRGRFVDDLQKRARMSFKEIRQFLKYPLGVGISVHVGSLKPYPAEFA